MEIRAAESDESLQRKALCCFMRLAPRLCVGMVCFVYTADNRGDETLIHNKGETHDFENKYWHHYLRSIPSMCGGKMSALDEEKGRRIQHLRRG